MKRIAIASGLVVVVIAVSLFVTVWSYRNATDAHALAARSAGEVAGLNIAEAYLVREREAMNEYSLGPRHFQVHPELQAMRTGFRHGISQVDVGEAHETSLGKQAIVANQKLLRIFTTNARRTTPDHKELFRIVAKLDAAEKRVLAPIDELRRINYHLERSRVRLADTSSRRAVVAAVLAGTLAIAGGLGFALFGVRLVGEIGARNDRLRELNRVKDEFVASVSHELRTPLTSIRGYLELVLDGEAGDLTDEQHQFLSIVERNADRLLRVVGDLLFVAEVDAGKIVIERTPTDVDELVYEAVEAARPAATEQGIELESEIDGLGPLNADRGRLAQVIDNLISNAVKFTPSGGRVEVRTAREGNLAVLEVADTGIGISEEDRDRLFQRFFRADDATQHAIQGTGLGLAIVQAIVEAHDGTISVASVPGAGTTFRLELPFERERVTA